MINKELKLSYESIDLPVPHYVGPPMTPRVPIHFMYLREIGYLTYSKYLVKSPYFKNIAAQ